MRRKLRNSLFNKILQFNWANKAYEEYYKY